MEPTQEMIVKFNEYHQLIEEQRKIYETPYKELYIKLYGYNHYDVLKDQYKNTQFTIVDQINDTSRNVGKIVCANFYNSYPFSHFIFVFQNGDVYTEINTDVQQPLIIMQDA